MAKVLTEKSTVLCDITPPGPPHHGGTFTLTSSAKLTVLTQKVLTQASIATALPGAVPCANNPGIGEVLCTKLTSPTAGVSTKFTCGGVPVLLETLKGIPAGTNGNPPGTLDATANQTKLTSL